MKSNIQAIINGYFSEVNSKYKTVVLLGNLPFSLQITSPNTKYLIKYDFDLLNEEIEIPENCIIAIDGGSISNGTLIGNNTILLNVNQTDNILDEVCRLGTWAKMYYSKEAEEFNFLTIEVIKNLIMNLFPGGIKGFEIVFVEELPTPSEETLYKIYLIPSTNPKELNITEEFITLVLKNEDVTTYKWEKIGSTNVDLINYYTKLEVNNLLNNKVDKIENKTLSSNDYTDSEKNKLLNIEPFAQKNIQSDWIQNDISKDDYIKNKPSNATSVSDGFMSKEDYIRLSEFNINNFYTKGEVDLLIDDLEFGIIQKVDALPAVGQEHTIYLVPKEAPATGFDEWIWVADEEEYELIGDTNIDLSDYYKKSEVDTLVNTEKTRAQGVEQALQNEILGQTGAIQTAISNANAATAAANTAATAANNVNATLNPTTNVVTITDRTGTSKSIDLTNHTNVELEGSVITVTDKEGNEYSIDLLDATNERVYINVTTDKEGQSVEGLTINAYYNNAETPSAQVTTDADGKCYLDVPNNYRYRLVFPTIAGCDPITDVTHIAHASERIVDVEYKVTIPQPEVGEYLTLVVQKSVQRVHTKLQDVEVGIRYDNVTTNYTTDANGEISVVIPYNKNYEILMPVLAEQGLYLASGKYKYTLYSEQAKRSYVLTYDDYQSGAYVVTQNGDRYTLEEFEEAREQGLVQNGDAKVILIVTDELMNIVDPISGERKSGVFGIDIDFVRTTNLNLSANTAKWATSNVLFTSIPRDGNSISSPYYFDGLTASALIINEQVERKVNTPAANYCDTFTLTLGGVAHQGFLGSVGQWQSLQFLLDDVEEILASVRPENYYVAGTTLYTLSTWKNTGKWTSTQNQNMAYSWKSFVVFDLKTTAFAVVPFFAF